MDLPLAIIGLFYSAAAAIRRRQKKPRKSGNDFRFYTKEKEEINEHLRNDGAHSAR
jgi:hypothetical protein